jgi:hypothetical protein
MSPVLSPLVSFFAWPGGRSQEFRVRFSDLLFGTLTAFKLHRDNPDQRLGRLGRMGKRLCFQGMSYIILTCSFAAAHWTTPPDPLGQTRRRGEGLRYNEVSQLHTDHIPIQRTDLPCSRSTLVHGTVRAGLMARSRILQWFCNSLPRMHVADRNIYLGSVPPPS